MKEIGINILKQLLYDRKSSSLNSGFFVYFLFFFILIYYAVRKHQRMRIGVFTLFSLFFFTKPVAGCIPDPAFSHHRLCDLKSDLPKED
jgi:hypothetical protein